MNGGRTSGDAGLAVPLDRDVFKARMRTDMPERDSWVLRTAAEADLSDIWLQVGRYADGLVATETSARRLHGHQNLTAGLSDG